MQDRGAGLCGRKRFDACSDCTERNVSTGEIEQPRGMVLNRTYLASSQQWWDPPALSSATACLTPEHSASPEPSQAAVGCDCSVKIQVKRACVCAPPCTCWPWVEQHRFAPRPFWTFGVHHVIQLQLCPLAVITNALPLAVITNALQLISPALQLSY
jgi:hypothetical protein